MSADNWAICPKCKAADEKKRAQAREAVSKAYGKVSAEEYRKMFEDEKKWPALKETMREDYSIGVSENGEFMVSFGARCTVTGCDFEFQYVYEEKVKQ